MNLHIIQNQELLKTSSWDFFNKGHSKPLSSKNQSVLCSVAKKKWEDKQYYGPHPQIQKKKINTFKISKSSSFPTFSLISQTIKSWSKLHCYPKTQNYQSVITTSLKTPKAESNWFQFKNKLKKMHVNMINRHKQKPGGKQ